MFIKRVWQDLQLKSMTIFHKILKVGNSNISQIIVSTKKILNSLSQAKINNISVVNGALLL